VTTTKTRPLPPPPEPSDEPAARELPQVPGGIVRFSEEAPEERAEHRSVLFTIGETEYTVLDNPDAGMGLEYLDIGRKLGPFAASSWAMETMLGSDSYAAMKACKGLTTKGVQRVLEVCVEKLIGSLNVPKED
jgi:hypothetical protein